MHDCTGNTGILLMWGGNCPVHAVVCMPPCKSIHACSYDKAGCTAH